MSSSGLFCPHCGAMNDAQAAFCIKCGAPQQAGVATTPGLPDGSSAVFGAQPALGAAAAPAYAVPQYPVAAPPVSYAGFWIRFVAYIIDCAVISIVTTPLFFVMFGMGAATANSKSPEAAVMAFMAMMPVIFLVSIIGGWLYFAFMESSAKQATLGKMVLKLRVTNMNGNRIGFGRATGRYFAKMINSFTLFIGWIIAGFTARKQALHDFIAGTVVLKTNM